MKYWSKTFSDLLTILATLSIISGLNCQKSYASDIEGFPIFIDLELFPDMPSKVFTVDSRESTVYFQNVELNAPKRPLILFLHGFNNEPTLLAELFSMPRNIEKHNFVLALPKATYGLNPDGEEALSWNATERCCGFGYPGERESDRPLPNDEGYLISLVKKILSDDSLGIDPKQVYIYGFSNGAFMGQTLACNHSELFAGLIAYAGTSHKDAKKCKPTNPINILQIHGTKDLVIRYNNPVIQPPGPVNPRQLWFPPPREIVKRWAKLNQCKTTVTSKLDLISQEIQPNPNMIGEDILTIGTVAGPGEVDTVFEAYQSCKYGKVGFWTVENGSHFNFFTQKTFDLAWDYIKSN